MPDVDREQAVPSEPSRAPGSGASARRASGRNKHTESEATVTGHSTADSQAERNQEDESPS